MKLGPVTKRDERKQRQKKFGDVVIQSSRDVIVIFPFYDHFGAIWKLHSGWIAVELLLSLKVTFYLEKTGTGTKKLLIQLSHDCLE